MYTCTICHKKAKTSYERTFGEKPTFEPVGFYCHRCDEFYPITDTKVRRAIYAKASKIEMSTPKKRHRNN